MKIRAFGTANALIAVVLLSVSLVGCAPAEQPEEVREVATYTIEQFLDITSVFGGTFSPDNSKVLVISDENGIYNAYAVPVAGGEPEQLTDSSESVTSAKYFPADERFVFESDQGGNELDHVYVRELDGGVVDLTPGEGHKAMFLEWADDEQSFFLGTNERDSRFFDIYEVETDGYEKSLVYEDNEGLQYGGMSPDKRYLALAKVHTDTDTDIFLHDRESGETTLLTPHEGEVSYGLADFGRDGKSLYLTTDEGSEFAYLVRLDLQSDEREVVLQPDWDVMYAYLSKNGQYMVVGINADARTEIRLFDGATMEAIDLPELADADVGSVTFSGDESMMSFYASSSRAPRNLYVYDFSGEAPRRLTTTLSPEIHEEDLVSAEVARFDSWDGMEIPGILYKPHGAAPDNKIPALVWVHGGPGGQSRIGYSGLIQYLVNHGYAVYAINNRGSSGYGKTFFKADDRKHGSEDLDDCVASKQMLIDTGWVDADKVAIIGGSYGGYMVLAALTFRPEEFAAGVDVFGISNWVRTMESIPPYWESFRQALILEMGDPVEDREYLESISPLFHSEKIVRPLMVLQGANDPRVIQAESDDIVEAVRANGVPVEYVVFEDEGHGFRKKENKHRAYKGIKDFLDIYVKGEGARAAEAADGG